MASSDEFNVVTAASTPSAAPHSTWHSPVPYLFGGLAAMLGLIAFALLLLACSYWKLSGYLGNEGEGDNRDLEEGQGKGDESSEKGGAAAVVEQKFLVIMAGQVKPTFLATPISSTGRSSFSGEKSCCCAAEKAENH
ncbi:Protein GLUTAMINE DUMPER 3 [Hibiscus syriacus]|uniref:Protein GLUTAMINE DUMPER 3 n=1 Tax=Hibiscus syriacus TaxID=106335 RepID=A0A6A3BQE1_HIBSY|nr:protein GLUTAMINE DUMPER 3-like [Hibiscus syriacus]KAE8718774.1 Protein GLUTAMINE DUMPER 3 [Hibiscus syriacus]